MKRLLAVASVMFLSLQFPAAQQAGMLVKSGEKGLYLEHKVAPKEGLFSIGRLYTVHPKYLAVYNKLDMAKGLAIGQLVRIPLTDTNFTQKGNSGTPLYYQVGEKEGLMKVSSAHRNVSLENLRNWNNLPDNNVTAGTNLVIGFLLSRELPSVTLSRKEPVAAEPVKTEQVKPEPAKPEPVKTEPVAETPVVSGAPPKEEAKKEEPVFAKQDTKQTGPETGYFTYHFGQQVKQSPVKKEATVTSGIFKTTSGWLDAKYYLLMDGLQPGTIVRISNPSNNKVIYAKVLGEMSGISQNAGLDIRISSAGASALGISGEDKFIVKVNY